MINSKFQKGLVLGIVILFVGTGIVPSLGGAVVEKKANNPITDSNTLYVGGSGSNNYTKIQDAIDNASDGDTVFVYDDSSPYYETINGFDGIGISKSINLIGEDKETTIIDGNKTLNNIIIIGGWWDLDVTISGFTIQNSGTNNIDSGICIFGDLDEFENFITINNNIISNNTYGIYIIDSKYTTITNNSFFNCSLELSRSYHNIVLNNIVNGKPLVYLEDKSDIIIDGLSGQIILANCTNITIKNQEISNSGNAICLFDTYNSNIYGNNIFSNSDHGIQIFGSNNNKITGNKIRLNTNGILLDYSFNNYISKNEIIKNKEIGIFIGSSGNNIINENNISDSFYGICLFGYWICSCNNTISNNSLFNTGYGDWGCFYGENLNNTLFNNSVNGKPLVILDDVSDQIIKDAGQIILNDCNNITVKDLDLSNTTIGLKIHNTNNCHFLNNKFNNNKKNGLIINGYNNIIRDNIFRDNNEEGIIFHKAHSNILENNIIIDNRQCGLILRYGSNYNGIYYNNITDNTDGINLYLSKGNDIKHNTIIGNNNSGIFFDGTFFEGSIFNKISYNTIINNKDGIGCGQANQCNFNYIEKNVISNNSGIGITLFGNENVIKNNDIRYNLKEGINLDGEKNSILENYICYNRAGIVGLNENSKLNTIMDNNISRNLVNGIFLEYSSYNSFIGNTISANKDSGLNFDYSHNNTIVNNYLVLNWDEGLYLDHSNNNTIISNNISQNLDNGIRLRCSINNNIYNNYISSNKIQNGITLWISDFNNIDGNNITRNNNNGIYCSFNSNNNISCNNISLNYGNGILIYASNNNNAYENNISFNKRNGVHLYDGHNNNIYKNNISSNYWNGISLNNNFKDNIYDNNIISNYEYGIKINDYCANNLVFYNNFINNTQNVYDDCGNIWDNGKYGNYWSDYEERYPNASKIRRKGIWNTPYEIEGGDNQDNCPLIKQWPDSRTRTTSRTQTIVHPILHWLLERFPLLERLLNIIF